MEEKRASNYKSCFDIIGPIMIGPSSSHTAGAVQMGLIARKVFGKTPKHVTCVYYESFAQTHKGHGTDYAIISGILGFETMDSRVPYAEKIAKEQGVVIEFIEMPGDSPIKHANTADLTLKDEEREIRIVAASIGGGTVEIRLLEVNGLSIELTGPLPIVAIVTEDVLLTRRIWGILGRHGIEPLHTRISEDSQFILCAYEFKDVLPVAFKQDLYHLLPDTLVYILE